MRECVLCVCVTERVFTLNGGGFFPQLQLTHCSMGVCVSDSILTLSLQLLRNFLTEISNEMREQLTLLSREL